MRTPIPTVRNRFSFAVGRRRSCRVARVARACVPALCGGYARAALCGPLVASRPPGDLKTATNGYCIALGPHIAYVATGGNPSSRQQTAPDRLSAGRQRQAIHDEVTTTRSAFPFVRGQRPPVQRDPRSKSQPPARCGRLSELPSRPPPISSRPSLDRHNPANSATMLSDRHPHSNRTGAPDHFQRTTDGTRQREYLPPRAFGVLKEQKDLIERTVSDPNSS